MSGEIKVGESLYDIYTKLINIIEEVDEAIKLYNEGTSILLNQSKGYEGGAKEFIEGYSESMKQNLDKINMYYSITTQYTINTLNDYMQKDEEIARLIAEKVNAK